jgi:folylpolyglutamate synthase/dihydropteroate synthase
MLAALGPWVRGLHLVAPDSPRARPPASYRDLARSLGPAVDEHRSCGEALGCARVAARADGLVAVAGSLYLVGEARRLLGGG